METITTEDAKAVREAMQNAWVSFIRSDAYLNGSVDTTKASSALGNAETSARNLRETTTPSQFVGAVDAAIRELDAVSSITPQEQAAEIEGVVEKCVKARSVADEYVEDAEE